MSDEIEEKVAQLAIAMANNDEAAGQVAAFTLLAITLNNFARIADALQMIARNMPEKGDAA